MSEESKTADSDYVRMSDRHKAGSKPTTLLSSLDDPSLSQEDRDLRLAIALQQQENAAVYDSHKKRHEAALAANANRTTRSNVHSRLADVRRKDHGMLTVPDEYTTQNAYKKGDHSAAAGTPASLDYVSPSANGGMLPQEMADFQLALELQKVEQTGVGTARVMDKILTEEKQEEMANEFRNTRSGTPSFHPTRAKKN